MRRSNGRSILFIAISSLCRSPCFPAYRSHGLMRPRPAPLQAVHSDSVVQPAMRTNWVVLRPLTSSSKGTTHHAASAVAVAKPAAPLEEAWTRFGRLEPFSRVCVL